MEFLTKSLVIVFVSLFLFACEHEATTVKTKVTSSIQVKPAFIPDTELLTIRSPRDGSGFSQIGSKEQTISLDQGNSDYGMILLFDTAPEIENGFIKDYKNICIGGATEFIASHNWNRVRFTLGTDEASTKLYECKDNEFELLDENKKVLPNTTNFPIGSTVYYIVLGFNTQYKITHSSAVRKFVVLP